MKFKEKVKKFWKFLNEDSWESTFVSLILFLIIIYFVIFPLASLLTGTKYFLVIVESCSMHHRYPLEEIINNKYYKERGISKENITSWPFKNGFNKGDIIFSVGPSNLKVGDVIIFNPQKEEYKYPIIHRIIEIDDTIVTKGDNNNGILEVEKNISRDKILAKSLFRIPYLGWIKLIFFDWRNPPEKRGFCK
ncbi:MAG: signal peptidase I [Candidatus Pacearchaeota archaeon]